VSCCCYKLVAEARKQFWNPEEGERPWLEAATEQRLVKMWLRTLVCMCQWFVKCSHELYKSPMNPITHPNLVCSHTIAWQYYPGIFLQELKTTENLSWNSHLGRDINRARLEHKSEDLQFGPIYWAAVQLDCGLVGYDIMQCCKRLSTFRRNLALPSSV
jgi:hypothetical protein